MAQGTTLPPFDASVEDAVARLVVNKDSDGRETVHTFYGSIGADWDRADVEARIRATGGAWNTEGFYFALGHTLAVLDDEGDVLAIEANPVAEPEEAAQPPRMDFIRKLHADQALTDDEFAILARHYGEAE